MTPPPNQEPTRPQFHFTAKTGWLNDPNGLVYYQGEYHLFFQHNPFGTQWGNMTWGHAVSKDLLHWRQLDEAIEPDALGTIFSGSAVVDKNQLVCIYTAAGGTNDASKGKPFTQCLAYSTDGRTFQKYAGNPVLPHLAAENRDPKVIWYEPGKHWVMALYLEADRYGIFSSQDLKTWAKTSEVEVSGASECPDIFELPVGGHKRWVFWTANGSYLLGRFDGATFTPETEVLHSHHGNTGYAAQTYFNDPHNRRIQIAWLNNSEFKDVAWNQQLGLPTELTLRPTAQGDRLCFWPIGEVGHLRGPGTKPTGSLSQNGLHFASTTGLLDAEVDFEVPSTGTLAIEVNGTTLSYDAGAHILEALGQKVEVEPDNGRLRLRVIADKASLEIFAQHGLTYMQLFTLADAAHPGLTISTTPTPWKSHAVQVHALNP